MHAEIAAAVAREQTPGLSAAAAALLEELLGRPATVVELEVGSALLRGGALAMTAAPPPRIALGPGQWAALAGAHGGGAVIEATVAVLAAGTVPLAVALGSATSAAATFALEAEHRDAAALGLPVFPLSGLASELLSALVVGLGAADAAGPRALAPGDVLVYLGAATGRDGLARTTLTGLTSSPSQPLGSDLRSLLRELLQRPGLLLAVRVLRTGGLAQAAASLAVGSQLLLDAVPHQPVSMRPTEILLAEAPPRALVVVPAERVSELLEAAHGQAVGAVAIGSVTDDQRLRALMKSPTNPAARVVCELPLLALRRELLPADLPSQPEATTAPPPAVAEGLAETLRAALARPDLPGPAVAVDANQTSFVLAARGVTAPTPASLREALSTVVGTVRATGATPTSVVLPSEGLVVALGHVPAAATRIVDYFPGPGLLVAVLGFADLDADHEQATGELCGELIAGGLCAAARVIAPGGLLVALAAACVGGAVGCTAVLPGPQEVVAGGHRYLLAIPPQRQAEARLLAAERAIPLWPLGRTAGHELLIRYSDGPDDNPFTEVLRLAVAALAAPPR